VISFFIYIEIRDVWIRYPFTSCFWVLASGPRSAGVCQPPLA